MHSCTKVLTKTCDWPDYARGTRPPAPKRKAMVLARSKSKAAHAAVSEKESVLGVGLTCQWGCLAPLAS